MDKAEIPRIMMKKKNAARLLLAALVLTGIGAVFVLIVAPSISAVTPLSCLSNAAGCLRFPGTNGDSLSGTAFTLPADFAGERIFVVVPFDEAQQIEALDWLPLARDLAAASDTGYYNLPVFPDIAVPVRAIIRAGLILAITDQDLRERTITLFLEDRDLFLATLEIPAVDALQVFLLNRNGEVIWRDSGPYAPEKGDALRQLMAASGL